MEHEMEQEQLTQEAETMTTVPMDIPEAGFEPYCANADSDSDRKRKRLVRLLICLLIPLLLLMGICMLGSRYNFYQKTMKQLSFDYREGEKIDRSLERKKGVLAKKVSEQLEGKQLHLQADSYLMNSNGAVANTVSHFDYTHDATGEKAVIKSGTAEWFLTKTVTLSDDGDCPPLYAYCFAVSDTEHQKLTCYESYDTILNGKAYICEVWLLEEQYGSTTHYTTLYRYYLDEKLAGLRVLRDSDELMEVYSIPDYQVTE